MSDDPKRGEPFKNVLRDRPGCARHGSTDPTHSCDSWPEARGAGAEPVCMWCDEPLKPAPTERGWVHKDAERGLHFDCAEQVASSQSSPPAASREAGAWDCLDCGWSNHTLLSREFAQVNHDSPKVPRRLGKEFCRKSVCALFAAASAAPVQADVAVWLRAKAARFRASARRAKTVSGLDALHVSAEALDDAASDLTRTHPPASAGPDLRVALAEVMLPLEALAIAGVAVAPEVLEQIQRAIGIGRRALGIEAGPALDGGEEGR